MKKISFFLFLFECITVGFISAQKISSTMLWKISGNGLVKPSYLFGTMHLTDERIFNLGDSLYYAIENTDGFAIELNPDGITQLIIDEAKEEFIKSARIKDMLSEKYFKKYAKVLAKKLNKDENEITARDIIREKNKWVEESYRKGKMRTFLDAYLFDIARRMGKWTGGVEDIDDQKGLFDNLIDESDIQQIIAEDNTPQNTVTTEQMIRFYINSDLNAVDSVSNFGDSLYLDALLTKRNIKMAMRMDSLGHQRSMVFAIGAAHLPGNDGVISLLKEKGFTVTPVFSSKKIKPKEYKITESVLPWNEVKDENGFYTASMPGKPGNLQLYGMLNMKMYFDIFTSTIYLTTALKTPYTQIMADSVLGVVSGYYFGTTDYKKGKVLTVDGVPGREFKYRKENFSHGYLLFNDGMMYMAIAKTMRNDTSESKNINRFLSSFSIQKKEKDSPAYFTYTDKTKAFSIDLPAKPISANDDISKNEDVSIKSVLYVVTDPQNGSYLLFGVNEAAKGYYIENDSIMLLRVHESQKEKFSSITVDTMYVKHGHKVFEYGGMMISAPLMMKAYYEFRGNRWYALVALYDPNKECPEVEKFFNSFTLLDYPAYEWKQYLSGDSLFSAWAPEIISLSKSSSDNTGDAVIKYESFDSIRADNFVIVPETFGKYDWQNNDSLFWENVASNSLSINDSLLSRKMITNGTVKGIEIIKQQQGAVNVTRERILLKGNKKYSLFTAQPESEINNANNNKFFEEFRFINESEKTTLFESKAETILNDLTSSDSAIFSEARDALDDAPFLSNDLPLLYKAIQIEYPDSADDYDNTAQKISEILIRLKDTSSYSFAKTNYAKVSDNTKSILLGIMASFPSHENFSDIKTILLQFTPKRNLNYNVINNFRDTLILSAEIFPDLLPLFNDTTLITSLIEIADPLLDSNFFQASLLIPYEQNILLLAQKQYNQIKSDSDDYDDVNYSLINVMGKMNTPGCNDMLQKWSKLSGQYLPLSALSRLLENNQLLNLKVVHSLASDKATRTNLYNRLKKHKKESLFPKQYLTQKYFAESYAYEASYDDVEPSAITYLTQKIFLFKETESRFFFYKVTYGEEDDAYYSLACSGPFSLDTKYISDDEATGDLNYEEDFDPENLSQQMKALIKQMEGWYKPKKEMDE